jgi:arylsulfatase A-like enzyme
LLLSLGCGQRIDDAGEAVRKATEPRASLCPERCPSIVLIIVDTLRADHLGVYGYDRPTSPGIDAWAKSGRIYENAMATSSWTLPSMASLLTGLLPSRHRAGQVPLVDGKKPGMVKDPKDLRGMVPDVATLAERLAPLGYRSGAFVTNSFLGSDFGVARGFEHYDHQNAWAERARRANETIDRALEWAQEDPDSPMLLMLHLFDPHLGYDAPEPIRGRFTRPLEGGRYDLPFLGEHGLSFGLVELEDRDREFILAAYDEEISWVDSEVERLRRELARTGVLEDAIVLLTSDHGEEFFEHQGFEHGHSNWQPVIHVPLILWGRGVLPGRVDSMVSLIDVVPTLLDAIGVAADEDLPGRSLWPNATTGEAITPAPLYVEANVYGPRQRSIIDWPEKLTTIVELDITLLFDLEKDPGEHHDLAAERPERVETLKARLLERINRNQRLAEAGAGSLDVDVDRDTSESLRSLGYVE